MDNERTATLSLTASQLASIIDLLSPVMDAFTERVAQRMVELESKKEPRYYSRQEIADILNVSLPTVHAMVKGGALQPTKIGRRTLFDAKSVDEAIKLGRVKKGQWNKKATHE